jgi:hypothetical protein
MELIDSSAPPDKSVTFTVVLTGFKQIIKTINVKIYTSF